jgi:hypothetical protein
MFVLVTPSKLTRVLFYLITFIVYGRFLKVILIFP